MFGLFLTDSLSLSRLWLYTFPSGAFWDERFSQGSLWVQWLGWRLHGGL